ncbi:hypothetical protein [Pseudomonas phage vB_PaeM_RP7]|uniref:Virion structural protein n=6 Tax=Nankokuvirus TaxID=1925779 RepID=A0A6G9LHF4_9CAUD|nr:virion structural protein [Pseudomonas phage PAK_P5]QEM40940.1 hypothetical protein PAPJP_014 [Pseudomonas phage PAP-JP]QIQ63852.1 hypothetical protein Epa24_00061 [Pseudomonas phage Epa24]QIQ64106.1 hypothetical protein Epa17_00096 [Pseudomonas phage Epa17]QIQ64998.1 putative structural protein [Pseudomonas phage Epa16]QIQ65633.1 putative structural protein [Pseudomonas phage Epa26]UKH48132.1 MAG: hypothetical protein [Pseudomonas phage RP4]WAB56768.1 hypothetical protein [Pseudomonas ph
MTKRVLTYAPEDVRLIISEFECVGVVSVEVAWDMEVYRKVVGIRGQVTRVRNLNQSARMRVELLQTSDTNDVLFDILTQDRVNQSGRLDLALADNNGDTIIYTNNAWISGHPQTRRSLGFDNPVWTIEIARVTDRDLSGSNNPLDFFSFDGLKTAAGNAINSVLDQF